MVQVCARQRSQGIAGESTLSGQHFSGRNSTSYGDLLGWVAPHRRSWLSLEKAKEPGPVFLF